MILIADGGSTKTTWCHINSEGEKEFFSTEGYNPFFVSSTYITQSLRTALPAGIDPMGIKRISFYGAGVHSEEKALVVKEAFRQIFTNSIINVGHDMLAAARALLGKREGFAAILGTGTNTCVYSGFGITEQLESGGYILGDEGSGCYMGKKLLMDYLRKKLPEELQTKFSETYKLTNHEIVDRIYGQPLASRFAAGFSKFIKDNIEHEHMRRLVKESFQDFFKNLVSAYPNYQKYTFNCIGSVGYNYKDILIETANEFRMKCGVIISSPIEALVDFHLSVLES